MIHGMKDKEPWHALQRKSSYNLVKLFMAAILMGFSLHLLFCHSSPFPPASEAPIVIRRVETNVGLVDLAEQKAKTQLVLKDGNHSITFLPVSELPEILEKISAQVVFIEGNHSTAFLPISSVPTISGEEETQASISPPKAETILASVVDEKQQREDTERRRHNNVIRRWRVIRNRCNMYKGQWIYDKSYPFYNVSSCPFLLRDFDCLKYGRPDTSYLKFRWKPDNCELPRFNALDFLWRWRGKKIMFVGDSLGVNNWVSLVCMLHAAVPAGTTSGGRTGSITTARFEEYDVEVHQQWNPYLVDTVEEDVGKVLRLNSLASNGTEWRGIDLLIFNSWNWWWRTGASRPFDYFHDGEKLLRDMNRATAFTKALNSWARWIDSSVDPSKTKIVYQGITPSHLSGREWGQPQRANCLGQKHPVRGSTYPVGPLTPQPIVNSVLSSISKPVHLLDITLLSQLRKDAHPSKYNGLQQVDCTHWCVGGLPDTWNQLLYAALV